MKIMINNTQVEVHSGETILEIARRVGFEIPSMCYAHGTQHKSSCMVCVVRNCDTGQIIPSCTTKPTEGMRIDTESEEVRTIRALSLELLLSDHRADCEAPCRMACPAGFDVAAMNRLYDKGHFDEALLLLRDSLVIPATLCYICNAPCEKVCRRGSIDKSVAIREIKKELVLKHGDVSVRQDDNNTTNKNGRKIAVIGSDPAGLSVAYFLRKQGHWVTVFERSSTILTPYIEAASVPAEIIELEIEAIKQIGVQFILASEETLFANYDAVIATTETSDNRSWFVLSTKIKQPARLVLEGRKLAQVVHTYVSLSDATVMDHPVITENDKKKPFNSTFTKFTDFEAISIREQAAKDDTKSGCLYCDCDKKNSCSLRTHATQYDIKKSRYTDSTTAHALQRQRLSGDMWFERAKCVKCGLCVYNSTNGFTFRNRGFGMEIVLPEENMSNITEHLTELCPTGALYTRK